MAELTQIYVPNDGQEFWGQNGITKHNFTHVMNTENVQQDGGEETQIIYLPDDGRNFEDKTPGNVLPNTINSRNKHDVLQLQIFQKADIALVEALRCSIAVYQNILIGCYLFENWYFDILLIFGWLWNDNIEKSFSS